MTLTRRLLPAAGVALAAVGCSPLAVFDTLVPWDAGARRLASDVPYGEGPRRTYDVFGPVGTAAKPRPPLLVFFHGGSWATGSKDDYGFVGAALAAQGFVAVLPEYRLVPEVGWEDFLRDCADAVRAAQLAADRYGADPGRILLAGHSAGAYNAAMLAFDPRRLARTGVPAGSLRGFAGLSGPYDFLPLDPGTAQDVFGSAPDKAATQPITFASPDAPPTFVATGADDEVVRVRNTTSLAAKLRGLGVRVDERIYPGLDHKDTLLALSRPLRGYAPILEEASRFLREAAGPA